MLVNSSSTPFLFRIMFTLLWFTLSQCDTHAWRVTKPANALLYMYIYTSHTLLVVDNLWNYCLPPVWNTRLSITFEQLQEQSSRRLKCTLFWSFCKHHEMVFTRHSFSQWSCKMDRRSEEHRQAMFKLKRHVSMFHRLRMRIIWIRTN